MQGALDALYLVDNNQYAFQFDDEVYHYFTEYVLNQDCDRLQWGAGRIVHHVDLSKEVKSLQKKIAEGRNDVSEELAALRKMEEEQLVCFDDDIRYMTQAVDTLTAGLKKVKEVLDFFSYGQPDFVPGTERRSAQAPEDAGRMFCQGPAL